jgi:hypothetical protein
MRKNFDARLQRLEEQMQPMVVASVLRQARTGPPAGLGERLLDAICGMKTREHQDAMLDALKDHELAVLMRPGEAEYMDTLPDAEILALAEDNPEAQRRFKMDYRRWRKAQGL